MTKNTFKKVLALLLAAVILCSLCACGKKSNDNQNKPKTVAKSINALIADGDYAAAYALLESVATDSDDEDILELRSKLIRVPLHFTTDDETIDFTYDENGWLLAADYGSTSVTYTYDDRGNCLSENHSDGTKTVFTYDESNNCLSEKTYKQNDKWEFNNYTYDENGNVLTHENSHNYEEGNWSIDSYTYDERGNILTHQYKNCESGNGHTYIYSYDEKDNRVTEEYVSNTGYSYTLATSYVYDDDGNCLSITSDEETITYTYNDDGKVLTKKRVVSGDLTTYKWVYTYDKKGNVLTEKYSVKSGDAPEKITTTAYTYDENGRVLSENCSNSSGVWKQETCTYENDRLASRVLTNSNGEVESYSVTYTEHSDTTTLSTSVNGELFCTATYRVFYYPNGASEELLRFSYYLDCLTSGQNPIYEFLRKEFSETPVSSLTEGVKVEKFIGKMYYTEIEGVSQYKENYDFKIKWEDANDPECKKGEVFKQEPAAGKTVKKGATVTLYVNSATPKDVSLDVRAEIEGAHKDDVRKLLQDEGFVVNEIGSSSETIPTNHVISININKGQSYPHGTKVSMVISTGPSTLEPIEFPDMIIGESQETATSILTNRGFVGTITYASENYAEETFAKKGTVMGVKIDNVLMEELPEEIAPDVSITLVVSNGLKHVTVELEWPKDKNGKNVNESLNISVVVNGTPNDALIARYAPSYNPSYTTDKLTFTLTAHPSEEEYYVGVSVKEASSDTYTEYARVRIDPVEGTWTAIINDYIDN